jgi:hypothetical protein
VACVNSRRVATLLDDVAVHSSIGRRSVVPAVTAAVQETPGHLVLLGIQHVVAAIERQRGQALAGFCGRPVVVCGAGRAPFWAELHL